MAKSDFRKKASSWTLDWVKTNKNLASKFVCLSSHSQFRNWVTFFVWPKTRKIKEILCYTDALTNYFVQFTGKHLCWRHYLKSCRHLRPFLKRMSLQVLPIYIFKHFLEQLFCKTSQQLLLFHIQKQSPGSIMLKRCP